LQSGQFNGFVFSLLPETKAASNRRSPNHLIPSNLPQAGPNAHVTYPAHLPETCVIARKKSVKKIFCTA
jgi:hypothetical protein